MDHYRGGKRCFWEEIATGDGQVHLSMRQIRGYVPTPLLFFPLCAPRPPKKLRRTPKQGAARAGCRSQPAALLWPLALSRLLAPQAVSSPSSSSPSTFPSSFSSFTFYSPASFPPQTGWLSFLFHVLILFTPSLTSSTLSLAFCTCLHCPSRRAPLSSSTFSPNRPFGDRDSANRAPAAQHLSNAIFRLKFSSGDCTGTFETDFILVGQRATRLPFRASRRLPSTTRSANQTRRLQRRRESENSEY